MAKPKKDETYLKKNRKYADFNPLVRMRGTYDIAFIPTKKGMGKTMGAIREGLIEYQKTGMPFGYARATFEQLKAFAAPDKYNELLKTLGYHVTKNEKVSTSGHHKLKYKTKKNPTRNMEPITYFLSVNQAMTIQSSKFKPLTHFIFDEIMHHFATQKQEHLDKVVNLVASVLRDHNCPVWFISNNIDQNDIIIRTYGLEREINKVKPGNIKRIIRHRKVNGEIITLRILIYRPKESKIFNESNSQSVAFKLAAFTDYGKVINSEDFVRGLKKLRYIKRLGNFKNKLNINGYTFGLWTYIDDTGKEIYQFSRKYNKNGRTYYFSYGDWSDSNILGPLDFIKRTKNKLIRKEVEFQDSLVFESIINLLKAKK